MNSRFSLRRSGVLVLLGFALTVTFAVGASRASAALFPQCPPVGLNTGCAILITVDPSGQVSVQADPNPPNDGSYDGADDTLVGIQNNAQAIISSVDLSSATQPIFGFDGDGICDPASWPGGPGNGPAPGCPSTEGFGPTGYEGPNNTFDNISPDEMSGRVVFTAALQPGGSAYWALEETLSAADVNVGTIVLTPVAVPQPVAPVVQPVQPVVKKKAKKCKKGKRKVKVHGKVRCVKKKAKVKPGFTG